MARIFRENSFEGAPGGSGGTLNYSTGYGTPAGGNTVQNPDKFGARDLNKAPAHGENQDTGSMLAQLPTRRDRKSSSGAPIKQGVMADKVGFEDSEPKGTDDKPNTLPQNGSQPLQAEPDQDYYPNGEPPPSDSSNDNQSDIPGKNDDTKKGGFYQNAPADKSVIQPDDAFNKDVDQLFQKKITPTPDEIMSALQYELNQMVKKDKHVAKATVLKNLKQDPKYYTRLDMLNIDDDKMKVDESKFTKTKNLLDQMVSDRQKNRPVQNSKEITDIFKDLWNRRHGERDRK